MASLRRPGKRQAVKDHVVRLIEEQGLQPGEQILSQNQLADILGVTAVTVHKALTELVEEGVIHRTKGSGTYVGRSPRRLATRRLCLVLPGANLDRPERNPFYWAQVKRLYQAFMHSVGDRWTFAARVVEPDTPPAAVEHHFSDMDVVFFHHTKQPRSLWTHLVRQARVPVVAFGLPDEDVPCLTIDHDPVAGVQLAIDHLVELGHQRIALLASKYDWAAFWIEGYRRGLAAHGLGHPLVVRTGEGHHEGAAAAREFMHRGMPCDAIVVDSDMRALGLVDGLRQAGVRVPEEVSIIGYEGLENATHQPPFLTSIRIPFERMIGDVLAEIEAMPGKPTEHRHRSYLGELLPGRTCAPHRQTVRNP